MLTVSMIDPLTQRKRLFAWPERGLLRRFYVRFPSRAGTAKVDERNSEFGAAAQEPLHSARIHRATGMGVINLRWTRN
jgi:hypothetical protein